LVSCSTLKQSLNARRQDSLYKLQNRKISVGKCGNKKDMRKDPYAVNTWIFHGRKSRVKIAKKVLAAPSFSLIYR